jgi:hypothetical protein
MTDQELINAEFKEGKKSFEYLAERCGNEFDFFKVHKVMMALNWCWFFGKDVDGMDLMGVPSVSTIRNHAYRLLKEAYEDGGRHGTGGFTAGMEEGELYLEFSIEDWSTTAIVTQ